MPDDGPRWYPGAVGEDRDGRVLLDSVALWQGVEGFFGAHRVCERDSSAILWGMVGINHHSR